MAKENGMLALKSRNLRTVLITVLSSVLTAGLIASGPTIAAVFDSQNTHKVDGFHAVKSSTTIAKRKGKLLALSPTTGKYPNNVIDQAPDAAKLGGLSAGSHVLKTDLPEIHDSGLIGITAVPGAGNGKDVLTVGPIEYKGSCLDLENGSNRARFRVEKMSGESDVVYVGSQGPIDLATFPQTALTLEGSDAVVIDEFRVQRADGSYHLGWIIMGVFNFGEDCSFYAFVEEFDAP